MRLLITGGAGSIGTRLVERIRSEASVVVFDAQAASTPAPDVEYRQGDLSSLTELEKSMKGVDVVVHLAAIPVDVPRQAPKLMAVNFSGTFNVLEAAARANVRRVVFASSICAVGFMFWKRPWTPDYFPVDENHELKPDDMYGMSKAGGEMLARGYSERYSIETVSLRLAPVWFEDMRPLTTLWAAGSIRPEINADGLWSYVDVSDAVQALRLASTVPLSGHHVFNIGAADVCADEDSLTLVSRYYRDVETIRMQELGENPRAALWSIRRASETLGYAPRINWRSYIPRLRDEVLVAAESMSLEEFHTFVCSAAASA